MIMLALKIFYMVLSKISTFGFGIWPEAEYFQVFSLRLRPNVKMQLRSFTGPDRLQAFKLKTLCSTNLDEGLCHGGGTLLLQTYDTRNRPRSS